MKFDIFKSAVLQALADMITAWGKGDIKWNVSNQFDETILESAFDEFSHDEDLQYKCYAKFNAELPENIMNLAFVASTFEVEPMSSAWTQ